MAWMRAGSQQTCTANVRPDPMDPRDTFELPDRARQCIEVAAPCETLDRTHIRSARPRPVPVHMQASPLLGARRLIVKIGSTLLVDPANGEIRSSWLEALIEDVARCRNRGQEVLIVTSGAVAVGARYCDHPCGEMRLEEKQAASAIGQIRLMFAYEQGFRRHGLRVGQVLLTSDDIRSKRRHMNARATLEQLLELGVVPVINENDTTATGEIRFGDNDRLAAQVAHVVSADALVLFSDVDGLYTSDPRSNPSATLVPTVHAITPEIEAMAGHARPGHSSGGMVTKLAAARIAMDARCRVVISTGNRPYPLTEIEKGGPSTWFLPAAHSRPPRHWLEVSARARGAHEKALHTICK